MEKVGYSGEQCVGVHIIPHGRFMFRCHMSVCFDHADSFEIDHFDQYFHLIFWLKVVNNDTVFEAIVLAYDRYESPLGGRSCHKYLVV